MLSMPRWLPLVLAAGLLSSCETSRSLAGATEVETHAAMSGWINDASNAIWDVRNSARSETARLDPARIDDADWLKLEEASRSLEIHFRRLANAGTVNVENEGAQQPGFARQDQIQSRIDADPEWFRKISLQMADNAQELNAAAQARNPQRASDLIENLNEPCQTCHTRYWEKTAP